MTAVAATAVTFDFAAVDTIDRQATTVDASNVAVPAEQWNATAVVLCSVADGMMRPEVHLSMVGDNVEYKPTVDSDRRVVIGDGLDGALDAYRADPAGMSDVDALRTTYAQAAIFRAVQMGRIRAAAADAPRVTGLHPLVWATFAAGTVIVVAGIAAYAWLRAQANAQAVVAKTEDHAMDVAVAQAGRLGLARLEEQRATGRLPPPTPLEISVADVVRQNALAHRENASQGYVAEAMRALTGAGNAVSQSTGDGVKYGVAAFVLYMLVTNSKR